MLKITCMTSLLVLAIAIGVASAQGDASSYSIHGSNRTHTESSESFDKAPHNPSPQEQRRLRVQWGKASVANPRPLHSHRVLTVRGQLLIASEDGKVVRPVDWLQGVRIVVARIPKAQPDWSKRYDEKDSACADCVIEKGGEFRADLEPYELRRPVGGVELFQVALSLGTHSGRQITWRNSVPVLPQSVAMIEVAGPRPISPILQAINGAPSVDGEKFNPVMLVRAVNRLHALGKEKAIKEMREYLKIAGDWYSAERNPADIDTSDHQCLFLIIRLLFRPADPTEKRPHMWIGQLVPSPPIGDLAWPLFPLEVQDDVPFLVTSGADLIGRPEHPKSHVDWAEKYGQLRTRPLHPGDNPLLSVDELLARPKAKHLLGNWRYTDMVRRQAWRAIAHLVDPKDLPKQSERCATIPWTEYKAIAAKLKISWSEQEQNYVVK